MELNWGVTVVEQRVAVPEVDQSGEGFDSVTFRQLRILNFDHLNTEQVALVVNILQFGEHVVTSFASRLVCEKKRTSQ